MSAGGSGPSSLVLVVVGVVAVLAGAAGGLLLLQGLDTREPPGVSPGGETAAGEPSASPAAVYQDAPAIAAALEEAGVECTDFRVLEQDHPGLRSFALCFVGETREHETDIYVFEDAETRSRWIAGFPQDSGFYLLAGPNWYITSGSRADIKLLRSVLGGELLRTGS